jgi:hypothetical protein
LFAHVVGAKKTIESQKKKSADPFMQFIDALANASDQCQTPMLQLGLKMKKKKSKSLYR